MSSFFDYLASSAVSLTVSGNTGISPFLTLFLIGIIEVSDPEILNMDGTIESILSSWFSIAILGVLTLLEFVGKCVPVIDETIDSVEIFVVPLLSIFASLGTFGLLDLVANEGTSTSGEEDGGDGRMLSVGDSALTAVKVILAIVGVGLALAIHLFKMLIRLTGLVCCGGCCQPCITVVEVSCVITGVLFAIFVREIAIVTAIILFIAASYAIFRRYYSEKNDGQNQAPNNTNTNTGATTTTTTATQQINNNNNNGTTLVLSNQNKPDVEDPATPTTPVQPSAPVELSELTPIAPPPATNPYYNPTATPTAPISSDYKDIEPIAVVAERVE